VERRKSGQYEVGRARRDAIITVAQQRFDEEGFHSTAMTSIAAEVGISASGLLHHFPTKKHLLIAVAERRFDFVNRWVAEVPPASDGLRAFHALLELTRHQLEQPGLIELFVLVAAEAADPSGPAHAMYAEQYERGVGEMTAHLLDGVASGQLRPDLDYAVIARRSIAVTDGLQLQWVLSGGALDLLGELSAYIESVTADLRVRSSALD
jgi:AcrR family transcriptional regulator